jgi:uncharacterized membrane protein
MEVRHSIRIEMKSQTIHYLMIRPKIFSLKFLFKLSLILVIVFTLILTGAHEAMAARSGGRIGGGSFRTPTRSAPSGGYRSPGGGYGGGGIGFPFLIPFFGFGGGGLFTMLIFFALISFLIRAFQNAGFGSGDGYTNNTYTTSSVAQVQVGLLATARGLQQELDRLALTADMSSPEGRVMVCQEASLALLRHPEYWIYATADSSEASLNVTEAAFNQLSLTERSKFSEETLSNFENRLLHPSSSESNSSLTTSDQETSGYIVVTIIVGVTGSLNLPKINDSQDLRKALQIIGGIGSDRLLAIEVLWTPQAAGDTLSSEDILTYYPDLRLL